MGMNWNDAKRCGISHLWPAAATPLETLYPAPKRKAPADGMNKLERAFWERLEEAKRQAVFLDVWREPFKLRVVSNRYYIPDFVTHDAFNNHVTIWETKGFMREDAELKLLAAAERYFCFRWVLVQRDRRKWRCIEVTRSGFGRVEFCPDWLQ